MPLNSSVLENGDIIITSGERLTIETAADFTRLTRDALKTSTTVAVAFEPGVEIDITGLQVLCAACRNAAASGKTFTLHGPVPGSLTDMAAACGAERHTVCKHNNNSSCLWFGGDDEWKN